MSRGDDVQVAPPIDAPPPGDDDRDPSGVGGKPPREEPAWKQRLSYDAKTGKLKDTLANATTILQHDTKWEGVLGYDERAEQPVLLRRPPFWDVPAALLQVPRQLEDSDDVRTIQWLEQTHQVSVTIGNVHAALNTVARLAPFDRVRDYLSSLRWDGYERLDQWTITYLGVEPTDYARAVSRRWPISAVARTFEPGCKADHAIVLEGEQGVGKSSALVVLAGEEHFGDDVPPVGTKDAQQYLGSLWVVELAEMDAATKAEAATLKRFLTTTEDRYRPPYGRRMIRHPRRCVFAGSVNPADGYLRDPTGGRRFWPLQCGTINLPALARARDQIWAEAVVAYRAGEPWHLTDLRDIDCAKHEQAKRLESDPWEPAIAKWLERPNRTFVTTAEVLTGAIELELRHAGKRESNRACAVLRRLGWTYGEGTTRQRGWFRPTGAT